MTIHRDISITIPWNENPGVETLVSMTERALRLAGVQRFYRVQFAESARGKSRDEVLDLIRKQVVIKYEDRD
jgi:hypothetical protein